MEAHALACSGASVQLETDTHSPTASLGPTPPQPPLADPDWVPAAVQLWTDRAARICSRGRPFIIYGLVAQAKKEKQRPPGVALKMFTRTVLAAMEKDPRLQRGVDEKGQQCFWSSAEELDPTGQVTAPLRLPEAEFSRCPADWEAEDPSQPPADWWVPAAVQLWANRATKTLRKRGRPFLFSQLFTLTRKAKKRPPGVAHMFTEAVLAGMEKDPRLQRGVDEKGQPCFWSSSEEFGPTGQETATPPRAGLPKPNTVARRGAAFSDVPAGGSARLTAEMVIEDTTVDIVTYAQLLRDEGGVATQTAPPAPELAEDTSQPVISSDAPTANLQEASIPRPRRRPQQLGLAADDVIEAPTTPAAAADPPQGTVRDFLLEACGSRVLESGITLADRNAASSFSEAALLGKRARSPGLAADPPPGQTQRDHAAGEVYLNTHEPFCFATVGVQGGGKSHTLACVLEACLVPMMEDNVVRLHAPMSVLVLHYDQNVTSVCEATGLVSPHPALQRVLTAARSGESRPPAPCLPRDKMVVLVSPSFYRQRKAFYGDYCTVKPLLFRWHTLTADHIKRIMRIRDGDNQLYVAAMLELLRRYQRDAVVPAFADFMAQVKRTCNLNGQRGPLEQRIALLESLVAESNINADIRAEGADLYSSCTPGTLAIADLTDPLLAAEEANGIFQVLTEQYRALPLRGCGKLLALDEAHKFMDGVAGDGLSEAIVAVARLMRHDGMRLAVSTQSPLALAPELLELVTVAILHRFHSRDWFSYLAKKLPLSDRAALELATLQPGHALVFASRSHMLGTAAEAMTGSDADGMDGLGVNVFPLRVRGRITADRGASRRNAVAQVTG